MKICCLGTGAWGFCLAVLLASKGYQVVAWAKQPELVHRLNTSGIHPLYPGHPAPDTIQFTDDLAQALDGADLIVESVTSAGVRSLFERVKEIGVPTCPIVLTSKGIEQNTGYILPDLVTEVLGDSVRDQLGLLSGPSFAQEVIRGLPTSVVGSGYAFAVMHLVCETFRTKTFRVYPNTDMPGVAYGGALKNIVAIACGISDGMEYGHSSKAALMTRGLHEMRKLAVVRGCRGETLNGLSGMGDLCVTCSGVTSRNFRYGYLLAQGHTSPQAHEEIGMVVEGTYTCVSALQLSHQHGIPMPITEIVQQIIYEGLQPERAVELLMQREIKEEHL